MSILLSLRLGRCLLKEQTLLFYNTTHWWKAPSKVLNLIIVCSWPEASTKAVYPILIAN